MKLVELLGLSQPPLLGVDISCSGIKVVEIDRNAKRPTVNAIARAPLCPEEFNGHLIRDPDRVGRELAELLKRHGIETHRAATAIASPVVFTRIISVPKVPRQELAELVRMEAANVIPHRIDSVKFDYQVLRAVPGNQLKVILMAAKCEVVENLVHTLTAAGLNTVVVDIDTCAIQNSFDRSSGSRYPGKVVAIAHVGVRFTAVTISRDGEMLTCGDLRSNAAGDVSGDEIDRLATGLWRELSELLRERGIFDSLDRIVLSGQVAHVEALRAKLAESSGIATTIADPLHGFEFRSGINPAEGIEGSSDLAVASGLALREVGDKADTAFPWEVSGR
jgi:type IV pilus assembly protein PilM